MAAPSQVIVGNAGWSIPRASAADFTGEGTHLERYGRRLCGAEISGLGEKRGPILVQLPPSFAFDARVAGRFLALLRARHDGPVVCEPRHATWASAAAATLLSQHEVARVAADPAPFPEAAVPGGWPGLVYYRLHGSPRTYWSRYDALRLGAWADALRRVPARSEAWCVFDNTASGAAIANAIELDRLLRPTS